MARLQILMLPPTEPDTQPWALLIDQTGPGWTDADTAEFAELAQLAGAVHVLATAHVVDVGGYEDIIPSVEAPSPGELADAVRESLTGQDMAAKKEKPQTTWGDPSVPDPREKIPGWTPSGVVADAVKEAVGGRG